MPCLFVSGDKDPFGTPDELEHWTATIAGPVTHHWIAGGRHDLRGKDGEVVAVVKALAGDAATGAELAVGRRRRDLGGRRLPVAARLCLRDRYTSMATGISDTTMTAMIATSMFSRKNSISPRKWPSVVTPTAHSRPPTTL